MRNGPPAAASSRASKVRSLSRKPAKIRAWLIWVYRGSRGRKSLRLFAAARTRIGITKLAPNLISPAEALPIQCGFENLDCFAAPPLA